MPEFLFFGESDRIVGQLPAGAFGAMLTWRKGPFFESLLRSAKERVVAAADFCFGTCVASHGN
jgi:hypothetical protein